MARLKREALELVGSEQRRLGDRAGLEARFSMALRLLTMMYQPIVSLRAGKVFGFEALLRSGEPTLRNPGDLLEAADRLGRIHELGRAVRARVSADAAEVPDGARLFVNLHSLDFNDEDLYAMDSAFARNARRTVLEITERASLEGVAGIGARVKRLRGMGFQIAVDDLGAGYAGLTTFTLVEPELVKIDLSLVRDIDKEPRKQSIVRSMKRLCDELGTTVVAEGVETVAERDALAEVGCDLLQGFLFARPERGFAVPRW
jgi:EAL domain-containing protein (putative c-di-GMP-specific phosphodiesterase class I)